MKNQTIQIVHQHGDDCINYTKFLLNIIYLLKKFISAVCTGMERCLMYYNLIEVKPRCKTVLFICSHHLGEKEHLNLQHEHILHL